METERQLLDAIRSGDRQALRRLYDRYSGYTMAIALRYVPQRDEAQDVLQDSFVKILTSIDEFDYRGEGSLRAWVAKVVSNQALDWVKENEHQLPLKTDEIPDEVDDEPPPDVEEVPPSVLNWMIGRLPEGYRVVLNLHVFEQLSHKQIAQRLGIKESSSASQYFHARRLMAEMINQYLNSQRK